MGQHLHQVDDAQGMQCVRGFSTLASLFFDCQLHLLHD